MELTRKLKEMDVRAKSAADVEYITKPCPRECAVEYPTPIDANLSEKILGYIDDLPPHTLPEYTGITGSSWNEESFFEAQS